MKDSRPAIPGGTVYFCLMKMYFTALVAPSPVAEKVQDLKQWMFERYHCRVALKSPAHITLVPPFWMNTQLEAALCDTLDHCARNRVPFTIRLQGFSAFAPRVIYLAAEQNTALIECQAAISLCLSADSRFPARIEDRPFTPHVTIATRDLQKKDFLSAWDHFREKKFEAEWHAEAVALLRLEQKKWDVIHTSQLNKVD